MNKTFEIKTTEGVYQASGNTAKDAVKSIKSEIKGLMISIYLVRD